MSLTSSVLVAVIFSIFNVTLGVKVSVYYEALCPDSVRFIVQQLYPHYSEIAKYVDLELVPYGKAAHSEVNGTWHFLCQHGPSECRGNKYQACALSQNSSSVTNVDFVNCVMRSRSRSELSTVEYCAGRYSMDVGRLRSCSNSSEADALLAANGDKTPSIAFVPSIIYDDAFDQVAQDQSLEDFVAVVCSKISEKPSICANRTLPAVHTWTLF